MANRSLRNFFKENWLIILIFLVAFSLSLLPLRAVFYWDESVYLLNAEHFYEGQDNYSEIDFRPPLLSFLISLTYIIWHSFHSAKFLVAVLSALSVPILYLYSRDISKRAGHFAALIFAMSAFVLYFSSRILTDVPSIFLIISALYAYSQHKKRDDNLLAFLAGILGGLAVLMRFSSLLILFAILIFELLMFVKNLSWNNAKNIFKSYLVFVSGFLLPMIPFFIWSFFEFNNLFHVMERAQVIIGWSTHQNIWFYFSPFIEAFGILLVIFLVGLISAIALNKNRQTFLMLSWLFVSVFFLLWTGHKEPRYLLLIIPAFVYFSSFGIETIIKSFKKKIVKNAVIVAFVLLIGLSFFVNGYYPNYRNTEDFFVRNYTTNTINVADYMKNIVDDNEVIYTNFEGPVIALYSDRKVEQLYFGFGKEVHPGYYVNFTESGKDVNTSKANFIFKKKIGEAYIYKIKNPTASDGVY